MVFNISKCFTSIQRDCADLESDRSARFAPTVNDASPRRAMPLPRIAEPPGLETTPPPIRNPRWGQAAVSDLRLLQAAQRFAERQLGRQGRPVNDQTLLSMFDRYAGGKAVPVPPAQSSVYELAESARLAEWHKTSSEPPPPLVETRCDGTGATVRAGPAQALFRHDGSADQAVFIRDVQATHASLLASSATYRDMIKTVVANGPICFAISHTIPVAACLTDHAGRNLVSLNPHGIRATGDSLLRLVSFEVANAFRAKDNLRVMHMAAAGAFRTDGQTPRSELSGKARLLARGPGDAAAVKFALAAEHAEAPTGIASRRVLREHAASRFRKKIGFPQKGAQPAPSHHDGPSHAQGSHAVFAPSHQYAHGRATRSLMHWQAINGHTQNVVTTYDNIQAINVGPDIQSQMAKEADLLRALPVSTAGERATTEQATRAVYLGSYALPDLLGAALMADIRSEMAGSSGRPSRSVWNAPADAAGLNLFERAAVMRALDLCGRSNDPEQLRLMRAVIGDMFPNFH